MSIRQFGIITMVVALLILLSSAYRVGAAPPEQEKTPTVLPGSTPGPAINIRTKLQPDQLSGVEPFQSGGRVFIAAPSRPDVNADPVEPLPVPAEAIRTKLQSFQTSGLERSQSEGRLIEESPLLSKNEEAPIGALAQQTFNAIADATVLQGYPTLNFGDTSDMWAGYDDSLNPDAIIVRSLIRFNIAGLPANQVITKATLRVYLVNSWDFPNTYRTITTYRVISNWSESSINWNNAPGYGSAYGSKSIRNDDFTWHEFDVTNLVAAWYSGTYTNYGIMLRGPEFSGPDSSWRGFSTREGSFTPQLVIEYTTSTPNTPPTISGLPGQTLQANTSLDNAIDLWAYASDAESPDSALTFTIANTPAPNAGVSIDANRYVDINPASGWTGQTNVTIRVTDPGGLSDTDTFLVTVSSQGPPITRTVYLPLIMRNFAPPPPPSPPPPPPNWHWTGSTSRGEPMSFDVSGNGATWSNFKLTITFSSGGCGVTITITVPGPGPISNNQFSQSSGNFSFSGQLTSLTTASGTYSLVNEDTGCGILSESGTWTAHLP